MEEVDMEELKRVLNLGNLNHCCQLKSLTLSLCASVDDLVEIVGLQDTPAALRRIECIISAAEKASRKSYYRWEMAPGWFTSVEEGAPFCQHSLVLSRM